MTDEADSTVEQLKEQYPEKFASENRVFGRIHRGDIIFVASGCGEPQYLVRALLEYVSSHPKGFFDTEVIQLWSLGLAPYANDKFRRNFRHNSFFMGDSTRDAVNRGTADYTPISLSQIPRLFRRGAISIDVALIQVTLGISTLLLHVPVALAATHQGGALLVLTLVLLVNHRLSKS